MAVNTYNGNYFENIFQRDNFFALPELMYSLLMPKPNSVIYHQHMRFNEIYALIDNIVEFKWKGKYQIKGVHPKGEWEIYGDGHHMPGIQSHPDYESIKDKLIIESNKGDKLTIYKLDRDKGIKADYGIGFPPIGGKLSTTEYLDNLLELVKDSGRIVFGVPLNFLLSKKTEDKNLKKRLLDDGLLESVIKLPNLYTHNNFSSALLIIDSKSKKNTELVNFFNYQQLHEITIRKNITQSLNSKLGLKTLDDYLSLFSKYIPSGGETIKESKEHLKKLTEEGLGIPKDEPIEDFLTEINVHKDDLFLQGNNIIRTDYEKFTPNGEYISCAVESDIEDFLDLDLSVEYHAFFSDLIHKFSSGIGINELKTLKWFSKSAYLVQPERKNKNVGSRKKSAMIKKFGENKLRNSIFFPTMPSKKNNVISDFDELVKNWGYVGVELQGVWPEYAKLWFNSKWVKEEIISRSKRDFMPYLKVLDVLCLPIPSQSPDEQELALQEINKIESAILDHERMIEIYQKNKEDIILKPEEKEIPKFNISNIENEIKTIINNGESTKVEFKATFHTPTDKNAKQNKSIKKDLEDEVWKTICAFLNTHTIDNQGILIIGVKDNGEINGLEISEKIDGYNFATIDKFNLYFQAKLKLNFNIPQIDKITVEHVIINEKYLLIVKVSPLSKDEQEAYIRPWQSQNFEYYIRSGPSDQRLDGPDLVEHIRQKENL